MKFRHMLIAYLFAFSGLTQAAEIEGVSVEEVTDIRVECIQDAIADELEDEQMELYVKACVEERIAVRQKSTAKKS